MTTAFHYGVFLQECRFGSFDPTTRECLSHWVYCGNETPFDRFKFQIEWIDLDINEHN